jgi:hypothetical protein
MHISTFYVFSITYLVHLDTAYILHIADFCDVVYN